jgi:hypothetical protein
VIWAPRLTVFFASCLIIIVLFLVVDSLFENSLVAALSVLFIIFQPWYAWLSGTPMLEMYYLLFFFLGAYLFVVWVKKEKNIYCIFAGLSFLIATGFHVQSWVYINLFNLITIGFFFINLKQKNFNKVRNLLGFYVLGNGLIVIFSLIEYFATGNIFGFLSSHTNYSKWFYGGYSAPLIEKAFYYPKLVFENVSGVVWIFIAIAFVFILKEERLKGWKFFPFLFVLSSLLITSGMNIISVPATAAPGRYSLIYIIALSPYITYGLVRILSFNSPDDLKLPGYLIKFISSIIFLAAIGWGLVKLPNYPRVVSPDAVRTGRFINSLLDQHPQDQTPQYLLELKYWDFLGVETTAGYYDHVLYDRDYDIYNRNSESIFSNPSDEICSTLALEDIRYVALKTEDLKRNAEKLPCLVSMNEQGMWVVFEFVPD